MARRKEDWMPEKPWQSYSASVTAKQAERIRKRIARMKNGKQILEETEQAPRAKQFGELHYSWKINSQSNFLHIVPIWSESGLAEVRYHVDLSRLYAERLTRVGILNANNTEIEQTAI